MRVKGSGLKARLERAKVVFLDCDGVIFDSNGFKLEAMQTVLSEYPAPVRERMANYWRDNGGMSRRAKFEHFFRNMLESDDVEARVQGVLERFHEHSLAGYLEVDPLPGALAFARFVGRDRVYVVSGAEQDELREVFETKGIRELFAEVLGSPERKLKLVQNVLEHVRASADEALLVGDGARDYEACKRLGMDFVFLNEHSDWTRAQEVLSPDAGVIWADSWSEILQELELPG